MNSISNISEEYYKEPAYFRWLDEFIFDDVIISDNGTDFLGYLEKIDSKLLQRYIEYRWETLAAFIPVWFLNIEEFRAYLLDNKIKLLEQRRNGKLKVSSTLDKKN